MTAVLINDAIDQLRTDFRGKLIRPRAPNDDARSVVTGPS